MRPSVTSGGQCPLPEPRGELSEFLVAALRGAPETGLGRAPAPDDDPISGDDAALSLYLLYELHYLGVEGVDDRWEWQPDVVVLRGRLEAALEDRLRDVIGPVEAPEDVVAFLKGLFEDDGRSVASWCEERGELRHLREQAVLRSGYQLKEADPHTWAIPRLQGIPKAALVEIQADEYGDGVTEDMHSELFALTMQRLGLDAGYGAYLDHLPATTLSGVSLITMFGLHRRWRGAAVGHLAVFEMASPPTMATLSAALRQLGFDEWTRLFYDTHVVADASHQTVACQKLAAGLVEQEPDLAVDVAFGALALEALEALATDETLDAWEDGGTALRMPLPDLDEVPGQRVDQPPAEDPRPGTASAGSAIS